MTWEQQERKAVERQGEWVLIDTNEGKTPLALLKKMRLSVIYCSKGGGAAWKMMPPWHCFMCWGYLRAVACSVD